MSSCPNVLNQNYIYSSITSNTSTSGFNAKNPYQINFPSVCSTNQVDMNTGNSMGALYPNTCNLWGFQKPISS